MVFASNDLLRAHFARATGALIDSLTAGHKRGRAFDDVEDVGVVFVYFNLTWPGAAASLNFEVVGGEQGATFGKGGIDLSMIEVNDGRFLRLFGSDYGEQNC